MKKFFNEKDIEKFLLTRGISLMEITNNTSTSDNEKLMVACIKTKHSVGPFEVKMDIDNVTFKILEDEIHIKKRGFVIVPNLLYDFSLEWTTYILKKYPEAANTIMEIAADKKEQVRMQADFKVIPLQEKIDKIKKQAAEDIDYWTRIEVVADSQNSSMQADNDSMCQ